MRVIYHLQRLILRVIAPDYEAAIQDNLEKFCGFGDGDLFGEISRHGQSGFNPGFWYDSYGRVQRFFRDNKPPKSDYYRGGCLSLEATGPTNETFYIWPEPKIKGFTADFVIRETIERHNRGERKPIVCETKVEQNK